MKKITSTLLLLVFLPSSPLDAGVVVTGVSSGTDADYASFASTTDLVNASASTFLSTTYSPTPNTTSDNDGSVGAAGLFTDLTFWTDAVANSVLAITYALDTSSNTLGYDINSIQTINGWRNRSGNQGNQNYVVAVSTVGSAGFADIATVAFLPFTGATINGGYSSKVDITEDATGILASGVDAIRFTYTVPASGGLNPSPTIREIDVFGAATTGGPDNTAPSPDPMSFASAPQPSNATTITMEATPATDTAGVEYYFTETSGNPGGDDSPWQGSPIYQDTGLTTGLIYTYTVTARDLSANQNATAPSVPASATAETPTSTPVITAPTSRHIVQRSAGDVGTFVIGGTYSVGIPDTIEARAVVMAGAGNSGSTTAWQTIDTAPAGGNFSGTLTGVPAGGWYQLEVRSVIGSTPSVPAVLEKVGVGDVFVTAGQSNSASHSPGGYVPSDDRVCARNAVTGSTWVLATDPVPIASGTGGSVWPRFGDQLAATIDMPIGFIAVGVGGTQVSQWVPGTGNYDNRLKPAIQSFPAGGFRAVLWHQGESDSSAGVPATIHAGRLNAMISQSRTDAGWDIPWYVAEAAWHSASSLANQEAVVAGQRLAIHGDPLTFFSETTDDMHVKGSPLHFDIPRQLERSDQYTEIFAGTPTTAPVNGNFEDNRTPAVTGLSPLADGASALVVNSISKADRPLGWRILSADGQNAADGSNGLHNPTTGTYTGAVDTVNAGVLPNMAGKHVALLDSGTPGNYFLHSTRVLAKPNTAYTLTVALGVRDTPATFGTARLEITANGAVVANASFDKAAIDALNGSDASGVFTDASVTWTTGVSVAANLPLAVRVVKEGGAGTVLDFDNARFTAVPTDDFNAWIGAPGFGIGPDGLGFNDDPDGDLLENGIEAWFGTPPGEWSAGLAASSTDGTTITFTHPQNGTLPTDVSGSYLWSPNLVDWYDSQSGPTGGPTVTLTPVTVATTTTVTAVASESLGRIFFRVVAIQN